MQKIALVHDYFTQQGGAERVAEELFRCLPGADLFATVAIPNLMPPTLADVPISTSWMQQLPMMRKMHRFYFPIYPLAVASLDLTQYDLVISSSSSYAKGVRTSPSAVHICYCHTPTRWVWRYEDYSKREQFKLAQRLALPPMLKCLKLWDENAALQPDQFVANSRVVADRIWDSYRRKALVIHPPIDTQRFGLSFGHHDYYLVLSRLVSYKRLDIAIEACNKLKRRLVVIGDGPDRQRLQKLAGDTVSFVGRLSDHEVADYVRYCRALLFPGEEDFGMTPLELASAGKPSVAYAAGGALETIIPGSTGVLFPQQTAESLSSGMEELESISWSPITLRNHASRFDRSVFRRQLYGLLRSIGVDANTRECFEQGAAAVN